MQGRMSKLAVALLAVILLVPSVLASDQHGELEVVEYVQLDRYLGQWYEVASIPQFFQKGCENSRAHYAKIRNYIRVKNECEVKGKTKKARGRAWVVDDVSNAKLKVQFFWPFTGDYWIIELDEGYRYAVVGDPSREYLWILSRTPEISDELYRQLLNSIKVKHGYDTSKIQKTIRRGHKGV